MQLIRMANFKLPDREYDTSIYERSALYKLIVLDTFAVFYRKSGTQANNLWRTLVGGSSHHDRAQ